jgi:biotin synthase
MQAARLPMQADIGTDLRHDWSLDEVEALLGRPMNDLLFAAQTAHRTHFDPNRVQVSTLLSIKTGGCPEDCGYCSQSARNDTALERERLLPLDEVVSAARAAREQGATRFCMGAAWRNPTDTNLAQVEAMVEAVHDLGLETCVTLGMLTLNQAQRLRSAGLDYYNHNLDTSPEFYGQVITTRTYQDRLQTLEHVRTVGLKTCSGGILGMGESRRDRASMLRQLANLPAHPESVPINLLVQVEGTPLFGIDALDAFEFVRTIAAARVMMPGSYVRLSAGRSDMSDELQALCYLAGANSIFYGERLLTTPNAEADSDRALFERLGLSFEEVEPEGREQPGACHKSIEAPPSSLEATAEGRL